MKNTKKNTQTVNTWHFLCVFDDYSIRTLDKKQRISDCIIKNDNPFTYEKILLGNRKKNAAKNLKSS